MSALLTGHYSRQEEMWWVIEHREMMVLFRSSSPLLYYRFERLYHLPVMTTTRI